MRLRALIKRSIALTCAYYAVDDWRARRRLAAGALATGSGSRHESLDLEASLAYIDGVYGDYLAYAGVEHFSGTVAEIGPGDNFGVALRLLGGGAGAVHAIDRYVPRRDSERQGRIYQALSERHDLSTLFDGAPDEETIRGLTYHAGQPAERFFREGGLRFDTILSRAVLEHLYDPLAALDDMARALKPGGVLVHRIDLRDHGMFAGHHPLTFLTIAEPFYQRMSRGAGRPNRVLLPAYRDWLAGSALEGELSITRLVGVDGEVGPTTWERLEPGPTERAIRAVQNIRPDLAKAFAPLVDRDLAIAGCLLVARKQ